MLSLSWDKAFYTKMPTHQCSAVTSGNGPSQSLVLQLDAPTRKKVFRVSMKHKRGMMGNSSMHIKKEQHLFPWLGDKR